MHAPRQVLVGCDATAPPCPALGFKLKVGATLSRKATHGNGRSYMVTDRVHAPAFACIKGTKRVLRAPSWASCAADHTSMAPTRVIFRRQTDAVARVEPPGAQAHTVTDVHHKPETTCGLW